MTRERAKRLAAEWSFGGVCTLREGEAAEYHKLFYELLCQQEHFREDTKKVEPLTDCKQLTNAQRIRTMSDEEMAYFLAYTWATSARAWQKDTGETLYWLKQTEEDVEHENMDR